MGKGLLRLHIRYMHHGAVRFIDAFVDGLDLAAAGFIRAEPKMTGRPGYGPKNLLKLYIYGYLTAFARAGGWKRRRIATSR
jgi:hypothetical protein